MSNWIYHDVNYLLQLLTYINIYNWISSVARCYGCRSGNLPNCLVSSLQELFTYNRENFKFDQDQRIEREAAGLRCWSELKAIHADIHEDITCLMSMCVQMRSTSHDIPFDHFLCLLHFMVHCKWGVAIGDASEALRTLQRGRAWSPSTAEVSPQRTLVVAQDVRDLVELTVDRMDVYHLVPWKTWIKRLDLTQGSPWMLTNLLAPLVASFSCCLVVPFSWCFSIFVKINSWDSNGIRWERSSWNSALCFFVKVECRSGHRHCGSPCRLAVAVHQWCHWYHWYQWY